MPIESIQPVYAPTMTVVTETAISGHFDDGYDDTEWKASLERFLALRGRHPELGDSLERSRRAEIEADYPDVEPVGQPLPAREFSPIQL